MQSIRSIANTTKIPMNKEVIKYLGDLILYLEKNNLMENNKLTTLGCLFVQEIYGMINKKGVANV